MQNKTDRALLVEVANDVELMGDKVCELNSRFTTMRNEIARQAALITEQEATIDEQDAHAGKQAVVIDELKATIDYKDMMIASLDTLYDRDQKRATAHEEEASAAKRRSGISRTRWTSWRRSWRRLNPTPRSCPACGSARGPLPTPTSPAASTSTMEERPA